MKITLELKVLIFFIFLITMAELVTSFVNPAYGLFFHSALLFSLLALSVFLQKVNNASNLFLCLSIAPLIRIFSLTLPLEYFPSYAWYLVAGVPMLIAAVTLIRIQHLGRSDIGLNIKNLRIQLAIMLTGIPFGVLEYVILKPAPLAAGLTIIDLLFLALALIIATGFAEELVFRGILQNSAVKTFGPKIGIVAVSTIFAALHIGWLNIFDVTLVFIISLFFGFLKFKTGSLAGVSLSHGMTNVFLFLVMPSIVNLIGILVPN